MAALPCEASLFAHLPQARHEQVLGILAGVAAMQPRLSYARHILFAPLAPATETQDHQTLHKKPNKNTAAQRPLIYTRVTAELEEADFGRSMPLDGDRWVARLQQTPDPEFTDPIVRRVDTSAADFSALLDETRFRRAAEYVTETQRFVVNDVVLSLQRVLVYTPVEVVPELKSCKLLDASGAFVVEATVRIEDRASPPLVLAAVEQLNALRNELRGVIAFKAPERLSMDSRVKTARAH